MEIYFYKESIQGIPSAVQIDEIHIYSLLKLKVDIHLFIKKTYFHCLYLIVWPTERIWSRLQTEAQYEINHLGINITKFPKGNWNNCSKTFMLSGLPYSGNKFGCKAFDCKAKHGKHIRLHCVHFLALESVKYI